MGIDVPEREGNVEMHEVLEAIAIFTCRNGGFEIKADGSVPGFQMPPGTVVGKDMAKTYATMYKRTGLHKFDDTEFTAAQTWAIKYGNVLKSDFAAK